jgi:DNA-binding CsgD family transcriptional regulator
MYEKGLLNYKDSTAWLANRLHLSRATVYNHLNWAKSIRKIHIHQVDASVMHLLVETLPELY